MDDAGGGGGRLAVGVHMGHDIVADFLLPRGGAVVVNVGDVGFQLRHLLGGDGEAQIVLRPGQSHPQAAPGLDAHIGGEQVQHELGGVPGRQGGFITVFGHNKVTIPIGLCPMGALSD